LSVADDILGYVDAVEARIVDGERIVFLLVD
jgi:hypothetical protein